MYLNTGLDVSSAGENQLNVMNNEGAIASYFELSTGMSGCTILDANGQLLNNDRLKIMNSIISNDNPNLRIGFYHFFYADITNPTYTPFEQGIIFGEALTNDNIPNTNYLFVLDIEEASFRNVNSISLKCIESNVQQFLNGLNSTIHGNFNIMIYSNLNFINNISNPPMYESNFLTGFKLWLADALENIPNVSYQPTNEEIEWAISQMNSINWGGVTGWSGWQYAISGVSNPELQIDLDIFNMDQIEMKEMYYIKTH